jgi:4-amino-4-deoxy-L-arabinose transferase-like glycosyltransferase
MHKFSNLQIAAGLRPGEIQHPLFLITTIISAVIAQTLIINHMFAGGAFIYLLSFIGLLIWARLNSGAMHALLDPIHLTSQGRNLLLGSLVILTIATRFFDLNSRIYGLDPDETKWTVQSWYSVILHVDEGDFATKHYQYVPMDFWTKSIFLRVFGLNFISARIESAVFSLVAVICLYLLVQLITSSTAIGLISSLVFSLSYIELSASHQGLHGTPPLAWMLMSFVVCFIAIRDRKLWQFQTAGLLLALGMLTYETFYPSFAIVFLYLSGIAIHEVKKRQTSIRNWAINLTLITWPTFLIYFIFIRSYLSNGRQAYLFGLLNQAGTKQELFSLIQFFWGNFLKVLETTFSNIIWRDSLANWDGPLLNPLVLPFIVLGLAFNLWHIRRAHFAFIPLLYVTHVFSGCVLLGVAWPRVMYLSIPSLMIWAGFGLWVTFAAFQGLFMKQPAHVPALVFSLILAIIIINDHIIFKVRLIDPEDHQKRRELSDITIAHAKNPSLLFYPFIPHQKDFVELDSRVITYSIAGEKNMGMNANNHFRLVNIRQILQSLWLNKDNGEIDLIFDKTASTQAAERAKMLQVVLSCYPQAQLSHSGKFFDAYHFGEQALQSPSCYSPPVPVNIKPIGEIPAEEATSLLFEWDAGKIQSSGYIFRLEKKLEDTFWVEVEQSFTGNGWLKEGTAVPDYSGQGYLVDAGENLTGEAAYTINIERPGNYQVWFRTYKRRDNDQRTFVIVQGTKTEFAKTGQILNQWVWESAGIYNLPAGATTINLTREYGSDELYSTFIDAMVLTSNAEFQPDTESQIWQNVFSLENSNSTASSLTLPDALSVGSYQWRVRVLSTQNIIDGQGNPWVESEPSTFYVTE